MRKQLDTVLQQKVAHPHKELYNQYDRHPSPTSQLIQAIIDLITREDYTQQVMNDLPSALPISMWGAVLFGNGNTSLHKFVIKCCIGMEPQSLAIIMIPSYKNL